MSAALDVRSPVLVTLDRRCLSLRVDPDEVLRFQGYKRGRDIPDATVLALFDEALALFLCAPQALYAVNKHVNFGPYRTTFELAETQVDEQHWSRRGIRGSSQATQTASESSRKGLTGFSGASSGHAC